MAVTGLEPTANEFVDKCSTKIPFVIYANCYLAIYSALVSSLSSIPFPAIVRSQIVTRFQEGKSKEKHLCVSI